jgi:hypothetical protein
MAPYAFEQARIHVVFWLDSKVAWGFLPRHIKKEFAT